MVSPLMTAHAYDLSKRIRDILDDSPGDGGPQTAALLDNMARICTECAHRDPEGAQRFFELCKSTGQQMLDWYVRGDTETGQ